ncbi:MAG: hypothetical protein Q4E44_09775 [bacterium]|nr:hypothetical protein [bacterium]
MFLTQGGLWGTGTEVSASGLQMQALVNAGNGKYYVKTNLKIEGGSGAGYLNFADGVDIHNDTGNFFLDQGQFSCGQWTIEAVSEKTNVYTLKVDITASGSPYKGKTYYLSAESSSMNVVPTTSVNDEYSQWMFVTLTDIKTDFLKADDASISNPTPSPFFFSDPGFYRSDLGISNWTITSSQTKLSTSTTNKPLSSNGSVVSFTDNILPTNAISSETTTYTYSLKCYYYRNSLKIRTNSHTVTISSPKPLHNLTTVGSSATLTDEGDFIDCGTEHSYGIASQVLTLSSTTSGQKGYTYYIGNGYILDGNGGSNLDSDLNASVKYWQSPYGKDWTANIHGQSGIIQQTISSNTAGWTPGWYKVICKGFSNDGKGYLFAYSGTRDESNADKYQKSSFITPESIPATYVKASRLINDGTAAFEQSVTVYVGEGESLTFGVEVQEGSASSWTCFDSFALSYCGKGELNLIIDETQTSIDYLNKQVDTKKNQTLRLRRALKPGLWNSLVLPVTLNAGQVKTAFGNTSIARLKEADQNRIYFELVSLDDDEATAIEAGKLYIINPQIPMPTNQKLKYHSMEIQTPAIEDYYTINQVTFNQELTESRKKDDLMAGASSDGGQMRMVGTYVALSKKDNVNPIPANSYVLSGGSWMFATNGVNKVKGLRGWIETGIGNTSKSLIFNIDGVDEEEVSTGIDGLFVDGAETNTSISKTGVYSLSGQKISDNTNLPKGIYIVNGRKMIVK